MTDGTSQPIRPGQVWRRNSDGVLVDIVRFHLYPFWPEHSDVRWRSGDRRGLCGERSFRARYTFISDPSESTTPPTREDQP